MYFYSLMDTRSYTAYFYLHVRHISAYTYSGRTTLRVTPVEADHEAGQFHEVRDAQERAPLAHDDLRIRGDQVCPLGRHRANGLVIDLKQQPFAVAVVALAHAGQLLSAERMERVRYAYKAWRSGGNVCIPD